MSDTIYTAAHDTLDRLGDLELTVWTYDEIKLYLQDGYDEFVRRTKVLFDVWVIENLPPTGTHQTDLEAYFASQIPGLAISDNKLFWTDADGNPERDLGGGSFGPTPVGATSDFSAGLSDTADIPRMVLGGYLPQSTVEVNRVSFNQIDLYALGSQQARRIDPLYEKRGGVPRMYTYDKDGLFFLRLIPAPAGNAAYDRVIGGFGTLTQVSTPAEEAPPMLIHDWNLDEAEAGPWADSVNGVFIDALGSVPTITAGLRGNAVQCAPGQVFGVGPAGDLHPAVSFSISFQLKVNDTSIGISDIAVGGNTSQCRFVQFGDAILFLDSNGAEVDGTSFIQADTWYHLTWTYDAATMTHKLYVNGALYITAVSTVTPDDGSFLWGAGLFAIPSHIFDDIKWWDGVLSDEQVFQVWNVGDGLGDPQPVAIVGDSVITTTVSGGDTGGYGILRYRSDDDGGEMFPALGPWGTPTRIHPTTDNCRVELFRLGRNLTNHPFEIPSAYVKYVVFWAMARALRREGPGQDFALADHYEQRFEMGVNRLVHKRDRLQVERVGRFGPGTKPDPFGLGLPGLPSDYESPW